MKPIVRIVFKKKIEITYNYILPFISRLRKGKRGI